MVLLVRRTHAHLMANAWNTCKNHIIFINLKCMWLLLPFEWLRSHTIAFKKIDNFFSLSLADNDLQIIIEAHEISSVNKI